MSGLFRSVETIMVVVHVGEEAEMPQAQGSSPDPQLQWAADRSAPWWRWQIQPQQHLVIYD
jgi:hypothetical protein